MVSTLDHTGGLEWWLRGMRRYSRHLRHAKDHQLGSSHCPQSKSHLQEFPTNHNNQQKPQTDTLSSTKITCRTSIWRSFRPLPRRLAQPFSTASCLTSSSSASRRGPWARADTANCSRSACVFCAWRGAAGPGAVVL